MNTSEIIQIVFSGVVAVATVVYARLTAQLVRETESLRRAQSEPRIGLHIEPSATQHNMFVLIIENYGLGAATHLELSIVHPPEAPPPARSLQFLDRLSGSQVSGTAPTHHRFLRVRNRATCRGHKPNLHPRNLPESNGQQLLRNLHSRPATLRRNAPSRRGQPKENRRRAGED